ncbi:hypothetical protein SO802_017038 [Lithocarpus litseifolius]|uniref:Copper transporter n=1 Tax=Lithocarpus litseifolius TaxID=425828 RepID=A0AAW2D0A3_9ROSI
MHTPVHSGGGFFHFMTRRRVFENTEAQDGYQFDLMKNNVFFRRKVRHYFPELLWPGRWLYGSLMIVAFLFFLAKFAMLSTFHEFHMSRENDFRTTVEDESKITNNILVEAQEEGSVSCGTSSSQTVGGHEHGRQNC